MSWYEFGLLFVFSGLSAVAGYAWWDIRTRQRYARRLEGLFTSIHERHFQRRIHLFPKRHRFLSIILSVGLFVVLVEFLDIALPFACAASVLTGVVSYLLEAHFVRRQLDEIEQQLADVIDLIIGLLHTGLTLPKTLEMAMHETRKPLKPFLVDMVSRIRLGDDPPSVIQQLAKQIPLETFQLFSSILSVQWWSGGRLTTTLMNVSAVIRSRLELDRRIRTQSVESHLSVLSILFITYGLSLLMWYLNPVGMEAFLSTPVGSYLGAGAIIVQALGILWIARLSRISF
ncbi:MAG: type II secretion system F family protein [Nitrospirales bacterium]|nr:type II secretion system F family protein [Nitrospira sp.]MDR4502565.1 type II secretion system F family protein [Nitrospirales bacterium]